MLMQNKNAWAEFQSGQLQFAGLGAMEQRALKEVFQEGKDDKILKKASLAVWGEE